MVQLNTDRLNGPKLRALSRPELARLGEKALEEHLLELAQVGHHRHHALREEGLYSFLSDPQMLRYPLHIVYNRGPLSPHQFGQVEPDPAAVSPAFLLYLHPFLENRPDQIRLAIPFFVPSVNYGSRASEDQALLFGATVNGMTVAQYYEALCLMADSLGAVPCRQGETHLLV